MRRDIRAPKTIAEQGGLKPYLDSTAERHNGLKYKDFAIRINPLRKHPVPKTVIAEDFGVSSATIYSWLKVYKAEKEEVIPSPPDLP